jgi:5,10-methylenetetrahydromethanopterin reductase
MHAGEAVRLARMVEEAGVESVWLSEDLFFNGAIATAGAVAQATESVTIGFGVLTPYNRHPSLLAMDMAALSQLAPGRIILGLGAGVKARVDRTGVEYRKPLAAMRESVDIIRGMLAGQSVSLSGEVHSAHDLSLDVPIPDTPVPVYLASTGPRSLRQTGEIGDGLVLTIMSSSEHIRWATETVGDAARAAGRTSPIPAVVYMPLSVADDSAEAISRLKGTIAFYITRWAPIPTLAELFTKWGPFDDDEIGRLAAQLDEGGDPAELIDDDVVAQYCVAGSPEVCRQRLDELGAAGVTEVALDIGRSGCSVDEFASQVIALARS